MFGNSCFGTYCVTMTQTHSRRADAVKELGEENRGRVFVPSICFAEFAGADN